MKKLYRGPYIDAFCQAWFHLAQLFQRGRLKYEKVNGRTTDAKWWQYLLTWPFGSGELKNWETWLLPQTTWGRSEGMTEKLPTASKMCCFFASFNKICIWSVPLLIKPNILLISFIFNFKLMLCLCINVVDLIFVDYRFYLFCLKMSSWRLFARKEWLAKERRWP